MNLSVENISQIRQLIEESPISRTEMKENLVDHLCCAMEHKISGGLSYEEALTTSIKELVPNGFKEIEYETYLLLNLKSITMKKFIYVSGLFCTMCISVGIILRATLGSNAAGDFNKILLGIGFGGLAIIFIPGLLMLRQPSERTTDEKTRLKVLLTSLVLLSIGWVFKIFHITSANEFVIVGTAVFIFGFLPLVFLKMYRESVSA